MVSKKKNYTPQVSGVSVRDESLAMWATTLVAVGAYKPRYFEKL